MCLDRNAITNALLMLFAVLLAPVHANEPNSDESPASANNVSSAPAAPSFLKRPIPIEGDFIAGWKQTVLIETQHSKGESVTLWIEDSWLAARRNSETGAIDWQVFLCPIDETEAPVISVRDGLQFIEVTYSDGRYFIRDSDSIFRCRRMLKMDNQVMQMDDLVSDQMKRRGGAMSRVTGLRFPVFEDEGWFFAAAGPEDDQWNALIRLNPSSNSKSGHDVRISATGLVHHFHGDTWLIDDGELIIADRTTEAEYRAQQEAELAQKKRQALREEILATGKLPDIDATDWINTDEPLELENLKGKVVLIDFWGTWCGPCVTKLPKLQPLQEKFADHGLVIVAIHSSQAAETCADFIREKEYTFPVAIDSGKSAEAFAISRWPTYFLIDRDGKLIESYTHDTPTEEAIAALLDSAE